MNTLNNCPVCFKTAECGYSLKPRPCECTLHLLVMWQTLQNVDSTRMHVWMRSLNAFQHFNSPAIAKHTYAKHMLRFSRQETHKYNLNAHMPVTNQVLYKSKQHQLWLYREKCTLSLLQQ